MRTETAIAVLAVIEVILFMALAFVASFVVHLTSGGGRRVREYL